MCFRQRKYSNRGFLVIETATEVIANILGQDCARALMQQL